MNITIDFPNQHHQLVEAQWCIKLTLERSTFKIIWIHRYLFFFSRLLSKAFVWDISSSLKIGRLWFANGLNSPRLFSSVNNARWTYHGRADWGWRTRHFGVVQTSCRFDWLIKIDRFCELLLLMLWRFWYCNNGQKSLRFSSGQRSFSIVLQNCQTRVHHRCKSRELVCFDKTFYGCNICYYASN